MSALIHMRALVCISTKFIILWEKWNYVIFKKIYVPNTMILSEISQTGKGKYYIIFFCGFLSPSCRLSHATAMNVAWTVFLSPSNKCSIQVSLRIFDPRKHMNIQETKSKATGSGGEWGYWILVNKWGAQTTERRWVTGIFEFRRKTDSLESSQKVS